MNLPSPAVVTIIVPGFDVEMFAAEALESLQSQTTRQWTAILVDDASNDATGEIFQRFASADPRFRVVQHPRRRGLGAARNTALDRVDTEFVGFLDADDIMRPHALERLVSTLNTTGSDFAAGAYVRLRPEGSRGYTAGKVQPWVAEATTPERLATTLAAHPAASGNIVAWSKLSRTEFWREHQLRFPEGKSYEDQVIAQLMYTRARAFDVIADVVVEWRERADGSSITQHKAELPVMLDYLEAMRGGLRVLDDASAHNAAGARVPLILTLDLPQLVAIGLQHPVVRYREELGTFARELAVRHEVAQHPLTPAASAALATASAW
ncbi:glycosyltransferase family 2 protein (plasmid) [Coraliomargarita sp. W4R53]